jgi:hypothetical protein
VSLSMGGQGGQGGQGGSVTVGAGANAPGLQGSVTTFGDRSSGVTLQSIGGGGGNGGMSLAVAGGASAAMAVGVSLSMGGRGGDGGDGGAVTGSLATNIATSGNQATGLLAQSVGGGGGNGGAALSGAIALGGEGAGAIGVALGGGGAAGGDGGDVSVWSSAGTRVVTSGLQSTGVLVQSVGGGGGNGGMSVSTSAALSTGSAASFSFGLGGRGDVGGHGGQTSAVIGSSVSTSADQSTGVLVQSVGGGGGNGGTNISANAALAVKSALGASVGLGGSAGAGGNGQAVNATTSGIVQTRGSDALGVVAQSIGGGGGNGGLSVAAALTLTGSSGGAVALGVGGSGGQGGRGGAVSQTVTGNVSTEGARSTAVLAQSLGGGGGQGGFNVSGGVTLTGGSGGNLGVGVGGFGGAGGGAGSVSSAVGTASTTTRIVAAGDNASGVVAQSIGGGGGQGGFNVTGGLNLSASGGSTSLGVGVGGFGGQAGDGGAVTVNARADVVASGGGATGVLAQSVGGGGGQGAINVSGGVSLGLSGTGAKTAAIGVGGFGSGGGSAGDVSVSFSGNIDMRAQPTLPATAQDTTRSDGLVAESIGGGGGRGGMNVTGGLSYTQGTSSAGNGLLVGVGGFGGTGGDAGRVTVNASGLEAVHARGDGSAAVSATSLGGGGGSGGLNVSGGISSDSAIVVGVGGSGGGGGQGRNVDVTVNGSLNVQAGALSTQTGAGVKAQSIGGGGGSGGLNVSGGVITRKSSNSVSVTVGVGGQGGAGDTSGDVNVSQGGSITTSGAFTHGILAQSLAGGGGEGGLNVSAQAALANPQSAGGYSDVTAVLGVGGQGGAGAHAGQVTVSSTGAISTRGAQSRGIVAESLGGGGGTGGLNGAFAYTGKSSPLLVGVGGSGGDAGNGNRVEVNRGSDGAPAGLISTAGGGAHGIEARSIGGGGGNANVNLILGLSRAGSGSGGADAADGDAGSGEPAGFAVQAAVGGSGGSSGDGGSVTVRNVGGIQTTGESSRGIAATSVGGGGGNASLNIGLVHAGAKGSSNVGVNLGVGGSPADGGQGGAVVVASRGDVSTAGILSAGLMAQSIGGGGGNADLTLVNSDVNGGKLNLTLGRTGGTGGAGGQVSLSSVGTVTTQGELAYGLLAQSVGNGGGNSSASSAGLSAPNGTESPVRAVNLSVGLTGGQGGEGGQVDVQAQGAILTAGLRAHAVMAQSVGGGGGNGASANTVVYKTGVAGLAVGGTGGTGGAGGAVGIDSAAAVTTTGQSAVGLLAQSVGGGGGSGGMASAFGGQKTGSSALANLGGSGGQGNVGGDVTLQNTGSVSTAGQDAHGALAQSVGGGGGQAGMALTRVLNSGTEASAQIGLSVGGVGGTGGDAGAVSVTNSGAVATQGSGAIGLFAQALGGGGGDASQIIQGTASKTSLGTQVTLGLGATGGQGGIGGDVDVTNNAQGRIRTQGNDAIGVLAMSIGGGGGRGSSVYSTNLTAATGDDAESHALALSLGGNGGSGGHGGAVNVVNAGEVHTKGQQAHGILALSVGGGGGNGGVSFAGNLVLGARAASDNTTRSSAIAIGGSGGDGNVGGAVSVTNTGNIVTEGAQSRGISAQSIGGGGGNGSVGVSANAALESLNQPSVATLLNFGLGGAGGNGADGGDVTVRHTGTIVAAGADAIGIYAQSIGGGGGSSRSAITSPVWAASEMAYEALVGSRDGSTGQAGKVDVQSTGTIVVNGDNGRAIVTQSVNGGGGDLSHLLDISRAAVTNGQVPIDLPDNNSPLNKRIAKWSGVIDLGTRAVVDATAQTLSLQRAGDAVTTGQHAVASMAQSVGGGGGAALLKVLSDDAAVLGLQSTLGGSNAQRSGGGDVVMTRSGLLATTGAVSAASVVQSIGGGGGSLDFTAERSNTQSPGVAANPGVTTSGLSLGGDGGSDNHGGAVQLNTQGDTLTTGERSAALVVQSIGGGGGQAQLTGVNALQLGLGGRNGANGAGGNIALTNTGAVDTTGTLAHGIVLQSIGGGGGLVSSNTAESAITLTRHADNSGDGGNVQLQQVGNVRATGERAIGVLVQSLGGGGGAVDRVFLGSAGGDGQAGRIDIDLRGSVVATGQRGVGLFLQSAGKLGNGDIRATLAADTAVVFGASGAGVWLSGGKDNRVVSQAVIAGMEGVRGMAVRGEDGNDAFVNQGTVEGNIDLGSGTNRLDNAALATLYSGATLSVGSGNLFQNDGRMAPGLDGITQTTALTGNFQQSGTGTFATDLDFTGDSTDQLQATGRADVAGRIVVTPMNTGFVRSGSRTLPLVSAAEGLTQSAQLVTPKSAVTQYGLQVDAGTTLGLNVNVDFSPVGVNKNQTSLGDHFNRAQANGGNSALAPYVAAIFALPETADVADVYNRISPEPYASQQVRLTSASQVFAGRLQSCRVADGEFRFTQEGECNWARYDNGRYRVSASDQRVDANGRSWSFSAGVQRAVGSGWFAGFGIGLDREMSKANGSLVQTEDDTVQFGLVFKRVRGADKLSFTVNTAFSQRDSVRAIGLVNPTLTATASDIRTTLLATNARWSRDLQVQNWYVRPIIDFGLNYVLMHGFQERGAEALNLNVPRQSDTRLLLQPGVEVGTELKLQQGTLLRPFMGLGVRYDMTGHPSRVEARLQGADTSAGYFVINAPGRRATSLVELGADVLTSARLVFRVGYAGEFSEGRRSDRFTLKYSAAF